MKPGVVAHIFNPSTLEAQAGRSLSSRPASAYRASCKTAKAIQRKPVSTELNNKRIMMKKSSV